MYLLGLNHLAPLGSWQPALRSCAACTPITGGEALLVGDRCRCGARQGNDLH